MARAARQPDLSTPALIGRDGPVQFADRGVLLPQFALRAAAEIIAAVEAIVAIAPWRHMVTPGGARMSVAMSNCGEVGWVSDRGGYRYDRLDPESGRSWPVMPPPLRTLAHAAAEAAGFAGFAPDACLINRYAPGTRLTLHQDRNERDFGAPVVSVSLGLPALFLFGGARRRDPVQRLALWHGDVVAWGARARLAFHGIATLADGEHPLTGRSRINLTFRRAL